MQDMAPLQSVSVWQLELADMREDGSLSVVGVRIQIVAGAAFASGLFVKCMWLSFCHST